MGAVNDGFKEGQKAGEKHGKKSGRESDTDNNRFKESGKAAAKGAGKGAAEGAARGATKGAVKGVAEGGKKGAELGAKVPYAGVVLAPLGAIAGGAIGGGAGAVGGGAAGAIGGASSGAKSGASEAMQKRAETDAKRKKKQGFFKKLLGPMGQGDNKGEQISKIVKLSLYFGVAILAIILIAAMQLGLIELESSNVASSISSVMGGTIDDSIDDSVQGEEEGQPPDGTYNEEANNIGSEYYKNTGSLLLATDNQLSRIATTFLNKIKSTNVYLHDSMNAKYSGGTSSTVANKVINITNGFNSDGNIELEQVTATPTIVSGQASLSDERTIIEHILRAEKYNFNNVIWRSFEKDGNSMKSVPIAFKVDEYSKLKYPAQDTSATGEDEHTVNFFASKLKSYLQYYYIPLDLMLGTVESGTSIEGNNNSAFAYSILSNAYHEIVMDRYKTESLTRTNIYRIYDKQIKRKLTERTCGEYEIIDAQGNVARTTYCTDDTFSVPHQEKDIRESVSSTDSKSYSWNYVVSYAKMFDTVLSNEYRFDSYISYDNTNYNKFITKQSDYSNMSVADYRTSELRNAEASVITSTETDYYNTTTVKGPNNAAYQANKEATQQYLVSIIPEGATLVSEETTYFVDEEMITTKNGKEYTDKYVWNDKLYFIGTTSGKYNVESVKDVTGELNGSDTEYYTGISLGSGLNIIDLMNSDDSIVSKYTSNATSDNIGYQKSYLNFGYITLKNDLEELSSSFTGLGLSYGLSLNMDSVGFATLDGLGLQGISGATNVNEAIVNFASQFEGKNLSYMLSIDDTKTFFQDEWCAMFVSYCLRKVEQEMGIKIPIPTFYGCSSFWRKYNTKPGFYDVTTSPAPKTDSIENLAPLDGIQPGDIVIFRWLDETTYPRNHTALVKTVERDANGKVTAVTTIDGNVDGYVNGSWSCMNSSVKVKKRDLSTIATYISVSTVIAEAERGNMW